MAILPKLSEMVREMVPFMKDRRGREEWALAEHMRGNVTLHETLRKIIQARIEGRLLMVEPTNPLDCRALLARQAECKWFLALLERAFSAPVQMPPSEREQPD